MWHEILRKICKTEERMKIVKTLLLYGLKVSNGKIYCEKIEIPFSKIAKALKVDRRTVKEVVNEIERDSEIRSVFKNLKIAGASLKGIAKQFNLGVIDVFVEDPSAPGIIANVTGEIAKSKISIRQIVAEDPILHPSPKLTVITEKPLPGEVISEILRKPGVKSISVS